MPHDRRTPDVRREVPGAGFLRWLGIAALWCAGAASAAHAAPVRPHAYVAGDVLLKFDPGTTAADRNAILSDLGASPLRALPSIGATLQHISSRTVDDAVRTYANDPRVAFIEPNWVVQADVAPNDSLYPQLYGLNNTGQTGGTPGADVHAEAAWDVTTGSDDVLVAIIDTGIDYHHPDLAAHVCVNPREIPGNGVDDDGNGFVDDVRGWDFVNHDNDPMDDNSHGTHVAGTVGAIADNHIGVAGVSWHVRLLPLKFLNASGSGSTADGIAAIEYATRMGARILSNSWGGDGYSEAERQAVRAAIDAGALVVAAAGNWSSDNAVLPHYPASYAEPGVLSVAATDANDQLSWFSNFGATTVHLAAPGEDILSTTPGGGYGTKSGTSMATPHVSGAAALLLARYPSLSPPAIAAVLMARADRLPALEGRLVTGGRLNAVPPLAGLDTVPPSPVVGLPATHVEGRWVELQWLAGGAGHDAGRADHLDVRMSRAPITPANFSQAAVLPGPPAPLEAGSAQTMRVEGLECATTYYFAVRSWDDAWNPSPVTVLPPVTTLGPPVAVISGDELDATLAPGGTVTRRLMVRNDGPSEMRVSIACRDGLPAATPLHSGPWSTGSWQPPVARADSAYERRTAQAALVPPMRAELERRPVASRAPAAAGGVRVLLLVYHADAHEIREALLAFPDIATVDTFSVADCRKPELALLRRYHVVLTAFDLGYNRTPWACGGGGYPHDVLGDRLGRFVDDGGGLVVTPGTEPYSVWPFDTLTTGGYLPVGFGSSFACGVSLGGHETAHPIFAGVDSLGAVVHGDWTLGNPGRWLGAWSDGRCLAATQGDRVAAVGLYVAESGYWTGDGARLVHNAVRWAAAGPAALQVDSAERTIAAGDSAIVTLTIGSLPLAPGDYHVRCDVTTDDPNLPAWTTPGHVRVDGGAPAARSEIVLQSVGHWDDYDQLTEHAFRMRPDPGAATVTVLGRGDYGENYSDPEFSSVKLERWYLGEIGGVGVDCIDAPGVWTVDSTRMAEAAADSVVHVRIPNLFDVSPGCAMTHTVRLASRPRGGVIDFDTLLVGLDSTIVVQVTNVGNDSLRVSGIAADVPGVAADPTAFTLGPWRSTDVALRFAATAPGRYDGTITLECNGGGAAWTRLPVRATVLDSAGIEVARDTLFARVPAGGAALVPLAIGNPGGSTLHVRGREAEPPAEPATGLRARALASEPVVRQPGLSLLLLSANWTHEADSLVAWLGAMPEIASVAVSALERLTSVDDLSPYSAIILDEEPYPIESQEPALQRLADYVDAGGTLIVTRIGLPLLAQSAAFAGRAPLTVVGYGDGSAGLGSYDGTHPVMRDTTGASLLDGNSAVQAVGGAHVLARYEDGVPMLAAMGTRVIEMNFDYWTYSAWWLPVGIRTAGARFVYEAARWAALPHVRLQPEPVDVPAGGTVSAGVLLDAIDLEPGPFHTTLVLTSNARGEPGVSIPVTLDVVGTALSTDRVPMDFGTLFIGDTRVDSLRVRNRSANHVVVSGVETSAPFVTDIAPFDLPAGEARTIVVSFAPSARGTFGGPLRFLAADTTLLSVPLVGRAESPPVASVDTKPVHESMPPGGSASTALALRNAGEGPLRWAVATVAAVARPLRVLWADSLTSGEAGWTHRSVRQSWDLWTYTGSAWQAYVHDGNGAVDPISAECVLEPPPIDLVALRPPVYLRFGEESRCVSGTLELSADGGSHWAVLYPGEIGGLAGARAYDLSRWCGAPVRVRFHVVIGSTRDHCYNAPYFWRITDLALLSGAARWLAVTPLSGEVAPGSSASVPIGWRGDSLEYGRHGETLRITTNDPSHPAFDVPFVLDVTDATPALAALLSSSAESGSIRLTWSAPATAGPFVVERRTMATGWAALGTAARDASGTATFVDTAIEPGARYAYRLGLTANGATTYTAEAWVDVPRPRVLALEGATPNPAVRELAVAFSLPDDAPARLAVVDVAGRIVVARDVGGAGPGRHVVSLGPAARFRAGVYWVRLTHGGRALTRACVVTP